MLELGIVIALLCFAVFGGGFIYLGIDDKNPFLIIMGLAIFGTLLAAVGALFNV